METANCKMLEFRIPADTRYVSTVRRGIRSLAESAGFTRNEVADVEVAVSEAITNSVVHGSPDRDTADVVVKCETSGDFLVVEIEDRGGAKCLPPCHSAYDPSQERGRGIMMMRTLMDEWDDCRTDSGIRVRMAKQKGR